MQQSCGASERSPIANLQALRRTNMLQSGYYIYNMLQARTLNTIPNHTPKTLVCKPHNTCSSHHEGTTLQARQTKTVPTIPPLVSHAATSCVLVRLHDKGSFPPNTTHTQSNVKQAHTNATSCMLVHLHNKGPHMPSRDE